MQMNILKTSNNVIQLTQKCYTISAISKYIVYKWMAYGT